MRKEVIMINGYNGAECLKLVMGKEKLWYRAVKVKAAVYYALVMVKKDLN